MYNETERQTHSISTSLVSNLCLNFQNNKKKIQSKYVWKTIVGPYMAQNVYVIRVGHIRPNSPQLSVYATYVSAIWNGKCLTVYVTHFTQ